MAWHRESTRARRPCHSFSMASDILNEILAAKRVRVTAAQTALPLDRLRGQVRNSGRATQSHALSAVLSNKSGINVIAEFKRRSPSKGVIRADADPAGRAREYERGGAAAISVLTEEDFFDGSIDDLRAVREAVALPILRKDFVFDEYQVWESLAAGADALLLIVSALTDDKLRTLRELTEDEIGMDALVEVHSGAELQRAVAAGAKLIGVNNRDLRTFNVSLTTSEQLARAAPPDSILVSESGLRTHDDLLHLRELGFQGFLIGETLMQSARAEQALSSLLNGG